MVATGGQQGFTGEPGRMRGRQKDRDRRDVFRLAEAAQRGLRDHPLFEVSANDPQRVNAFGFHPTGIDGVDANLPWPQFPGGVVLRAQRVSRCGTQGL